MIMRNFGEANMKWSRIKSTIIFLVVFSTGFLSIDSCQPGIAGAQVKKEVLQDWYDAKRQRQVPVKIYMPEGEAPYPVVIFSHGLGGSREAAVYLGEKWSKNGYLCVFVQHPGSDVSTWKPVALGGKQAIFNVLKSAANERNLRDRAADVSFVLDELQKRNSEDELLEKKMLLDKIAVAGHSFGAATALSVAGQNFPTLKEPSPLRDSRVRAAIYLCPPVTAKMFTPDLVYSNIRIPGMLMTGTEDDSPIGETNAEERRIPFDGIKSAHQYLINFEGADHAAFGGRAFRAPKKSDERYHEMIEELSTRFLDAYLRNNGAEEKWLDDGAAAQYLGKEAKFERK